MSDVATFSEHRTDLAGLDEIEEQTSARVNHRTSNRGRNNWGLPPNIARASASREPKKPQQPAAAIKAAPVEVVRIELVPIEITGRPLSEFVDYDGLWNAVRARVDAMGITRHELDHLSGLPDGYSGKLLGGAQVRRFGKDSLGETLGAIGCKLVLIEDPDATAQVMARAKKRKLPLRQFKLLSPPSPRP
jgi:hypothetical protein